MSDLLETRTMLYADPFWGAVSEGRVLVHTEAACDGNGCCFHGPSDHHMIDWPMVLRLDKSALVERLCPHGVGHPDPDSVAYFGRAFDAKFARGIALHGCDGYSTMDYGLSKNVILKIVLRSLVCVF